MKCRYLIAKFVPDLVRHEPINIGVVLQSDEFVACRFIPRLPRAWLVETELAEEFLPDLRTTWEERLRAKSQWIFMAAKSTKVEVPTTSVEYLNWLGEVYNRHLQFTEVREGEVEATDRFGLESLLMHLYDTFVTPKPRARRIVVGRGTRLHTSLRRDFRQLKLLDKMTEKAVVEGTILWQVDFAYRNGYEVALLVTDFNMKNLFERARDVLAAWSDLREIRKESVKRISVVGNYRQISEHRKALQLVERYASRVYNYEKEEEHSQLIDMTLKDLAADRLQL